MKIETKYGNDFKFNGKKVFYKYKYLVKHNNKTYYFKFQQAARNFSYKLHSCN